MIFCKSVHQKLSSVPPGSAYFGLNARLSAVLADLQSDGLFRSAQQQDEGWNPDELRFAVNRTLFESDSAVSASRNIESTISDIVSALHDDDRKSRRLSFRFWLPYYLSALTLTYFVLAITLPVLPDVLHFLLIPPAIIAVGSFWIFNRRTLHLYSELESTYSNNVFDVNFYMCRYIVPFVAHLFFVFLGVLPPFVITLTTLSGSSFSPEVLYWLGPLALIFPIVALSEFSRRAALDDRKRALAATILGRQTRELDQVNKQVQVLDDIIAGYVNAEWQRYVEQYEIQAMISWNILPVYTVKRPARNLGERYDQYVETETFSKLRNLVEELDRASIGIAAPRGYGKTSAISALWYELNAEDKDILTLWLSAPTAIEEKEFLKSVLAKLATRAGARLSNNPYWPQRSPKDELANENSERRRNMIALSIGAGIVALTVLGMAASSEWETWSTYSLPALLVPAGIWLFPWLRSIGPRQFEGVDRGRWPLVAAAEMLLDELWYERKEVRLSHVAIGSVGASIRGRYGSERTKEPFTLPHLVEMWNNYVQLLTEDQRAFTKVVVFIDEVDKMTNVTDIGQFMLVLKSLYRPLKLFFLVSISEDAYIKFSSRGHTRETANELDSSFDEIIKIGRMSYQQVSKVLAHRIIGPELPSSIVFLIWTLARGSPRDVIRLARLVLTYGARDERERRLEYIAQQLIGGEFQRVLSVYAIVVNAVSETRPDLCEGLSPSENEVYISEVEQSDKDIERLIVSLEEERTSLRESGAENIQISGCLAELWYVKTLYLLFVSREKRDMLKRELESQLPSKIGRVQELLVQRHYDEAINVMRQHVYTD